VLSYAPRGSVLSANDGMENALAQVDPALLSAGVPVLALGGMVPAAFALLVYCLWVMAGQNRRLVLKAQQDSLTGLLNHASMRRGISALLKKEAGIHVLMILDLDHFKQINDTYGHNTGDDALKILAKTIILQAQKHGFKYCRWGGEEFLLLGKCRSGEIPKDILEELRSAISSNCVRTSRESFRYTVTIGAGKYTSGQSAKEWLDFVDKQLYKGKRSGKNQVVCS